MSKTSIQMLTTDSSGTAISLPYNYAGGNLTSSNVPADSYYGRSDGLHTVSITLDGFTGNIALEGTLATTPGANDWFRRFKRNPIHNFIRYNCVYFYRKLCVY